MSQPKITIVGKLEWSEAYGLGAAILEISRPEEISVIRPYYKLEEGTKAWVEPESFWWSTLVEKAPHPPAGSDFMVKEWISFYAPWFQARSENQTYRSAAWEFVESQNCEPKQLRSLSRSFDLWCYKGKVLKFVASGPRGLRDQAMESLLIKRYVLRRERNYEKIRREVDALENMERLQGAAREAIPESVRLFVWQRDKGQCVKCGSRSSLEFDHIIPVSSGGSSTERNVQLLCEACNRSKGAAV
ncbi:MAG: HNH endonuclease [Candidatus Binataceae bacterium]